MTPSRSRAFTRNGASAARRILDQRTKRRRDRQPEVGDHADFERAAVARGSDTDDRRRQPLHVDGAADDARIRAKPRRPRPMTEDGHQRGARPFFVGGEPAAQRRLDAEHGRERGCRVFRGTVAHRALAVSIAHG